MIIISTLFITILRLSFDNMEKYLNDLKNAHNKIVKTLDTIQKNGDKTWLYSIPSHDPKFTNFRMKINNQELSIACNIMSPQSIESILFKEDDTIDHDSLYFHENTDELLEYLHTI